MDAIGRSEFAIALSDLRVLDRQLRALAATLGLGPLPPFVWTGRVSQLMPRLIA
jgi:hypothetical protein